MATHIKKKCPYCGVTYESYTTYAFNVYHFGSPFLVCSKCNKTFIDKDIKEPALRPYKELKITLIKCILSWIFPLGMFAAFFIIGGIDYLSTRNSYLILIIGVIAAIAYVFLVIFTYRNRAQTKADWEKDYKASKERLQNKAYAVALKNAGFKVPSEYFE